jgi:hypothetical protein
MLNVPLAAQHVSQEPVSPRPGLQLLDFKRARKGTRRGFAVVRLPIGLELRDIIIGESHGKIWALLPSKAMLDRDGQVMRDAGGKPRYAPVIEWSSAELRDGFSRRVADLVHQAHPDAFDTPVAERSP